MHRNALLPRIRLVGLLLLLPAMAWAAEPGSNTLAHDGTWHPLLHDSSPVAQEAQAGVYDPVRGRLVFFGGWDGNNSLNTTRALTLGPTFGWSQVEAAGGPPAGRYAHSMVYDSVRDRLLVFGGRDSTLAWFGDVWALTLSGTPTWTPILPAGTPPSARFGHEAVYDPVRDRMLVIGGYDGAFKNDVWELTLSGTPTWNQLAPAGTPPTERDFSTSIYDPVGDRVVMYGGNVFVSPGPPVASGDAWTLSLSGTPTWAPLAVAGSPPAPRLLHKSFYDSARNRMVVMGGFDGAGMRNDCYALSLGGVPTWTNLTPAVGPAPAQRSDHTWIYDAAGDRGILFGGRDPGTFFSDVWQLSLAGTPLWSKIPTVTPGMSPRLLHRSVYDATRRRMVIFGGFNYDSGWLNDTWAVDLATPAYAPIDGASPARPGKRSDHVLIADPPVDRLVLFGGRDGVGFFNDTWAFDLAAGKWSPVATLGLPPSPREAMSGAYDAPRDRMLLFGGWNGSVALNEVWALALGSSPTWTKLTPAGGPPPARYAHNMVYDTARDRMIVLGGNTGFTLLTDVWALDLSGSPTWTQLFPAGTGPGPNLGSEMIYDPVRDRVIVFGGFDGRFERRVWELSFATPTPTWSLLAPAGVLPRERDFATSIYDPVIDRMIVAGGNTGPRATGLNGLEDVWSLDWNEVPTPTLLTFADEQTAPGEVTLTWYTPDGAGQRATAYRRPDAGDWTIVSELESDAAGRFVLEDRIAAGGRYAYRLGLAGASPPYTDEHWVTIPGEAQFGLAGGWANPSRGPLSVSFRLADARNAALDLVDVRGRRVVHRDVTALGPGLHTVRLDAAGDLSPGIYVIRLAQGDRTEQEKIAIVR